MAVKQKCYSNLTRYQTAAHDNNVPDLANWKMSHCVRIVNASSGQ